MLATTTGLTGWVYLTLLSLHLLCVIVGFGGVILNGIWGSAQSRLTGEPAAALGAPLETVSKIAELFILAVPVFGVATLLTSGGVYTFRAPWVSASLALYVVGLVVSFGMLQPAARKLGPLTATLPVGAPERVSLEKRIGATSGVLHLVLLLVVLLMVFGPTTSWLAS
jgi:hypothetical protein